ncbi:MAG: D-2-hydroxyacid dehydrogenase family protein [Chloroflexota bacterium]|nr:D-2-hydroxyacid dehydrogenase family protein [Chloroflexota bacterium]
MRVAILDDFHQAYQHLPAIRRLRERAEVHIFTRPFGSPEALSGFDALIANRERTRFDGPLLRRLPDLKIVAQTGNHAYHVDFETARELGIVVAKAAAAPGSSNGAAELTLGLMLALMRQIATSDAAMKRGEWPAPLTHELHGKRAGIVGLGNVGRRVAQLALAFGMRLLAWSPSLTSERAAAAGAQHRPFDDLLRESDLVTIHVPLSPASRGLVGAGQLALMKPSAYLVNTSRGPIVDEAALEDALRMGRIAGAALDVFDREPLPPEHPLRQLSNVVLTPHLGWPTDNAYAAFAESAVDALFAYLDGRPVPEFEHG